MSRRRTHSDAEAMALATVRGTKMVGPPQWVRCHEHPRRWTVWQWVWPVGGSIEDADAEIVRGCAACDEGGGR